MRLVRLVFAGLFALVCASAAELPDPVAAGRGQKLFVQACGFCHGNDATGSRAPDLIRSAIVSHDDNGSTIGPVIRNGRPDRGMPGFPFSDTQIQDIAVFLHQQQRAALNSAKVPADYPLKKLLTGNANAGKAFFEGPGGCRECHSPTGNLAGVARKYTPINLQQRLLYPSGKNPQVTVKPQSGPEVSGVLAHLDDFNVALIDNQHWYHSWPRDRVTVSVHDSLEAHRKLLIQYSDVDVHNLFAYLETLK